MLSGKGGSANGCRCCWGAPGLPRLPPATLKNPPPFIASLLLFVFAEMGATSTASVRLEVNLFKSETRGFGILLVSPVFLGIWRFCIASRSLLPISMQTKQDHREPVLLRALKIMLHAMLCLLVIIFLTCVCWHPERICKIFIGWICILFSWCQRYSFGSLEWFRSNFKFGLPLGSHIFLFSLVRLAPLSHLTVTLLV